MAKLKIELVKSLNGRLEKQIAAIRGKSVEEII